MNSTGTSCLSQSRSSELRRLIFRRQYSRCAKRRMRDLARKQKAGRELLPTRSLVAHGSCVSTGQAELKISEKKPVEGERLLEPPADQPQTKTRPGVEQNPEANGELPEDLSAPAWNPPSEGVFLAESGHQPEEVPAEPQQEPGGSRRHLFTLRKTFSEGLVAQKWSRDQIMWCVAWFHPPVSSERKHSEAFQTVFVSTAVQFQEINTANPLLLLLFLLFFCGCWTAAGRRQSVATSSNLQSDIPGMMSCDPVGLQFSACLHLINK